MINRYIIVGKLLHLIAFIALLLSVGFLEITLMVYEKSILLTWLYGYFSYFFFGVFLFAQLDARSRYQNFKRLVDQLIDYGYNERLFKRLLHSRCQRDAAEAAGKMTGYFHEITGYFYQSGYRWYHIFPDFVFSKPKFLLTMHFWQTTFFVPNYKSRYDLKSL